MPTLDELFAAKSNDRLNKATEMADYLGLTPPEQPKEAVRYKSKKQQRRRSRRAKGAGKPKSGQDGKKTRRDTISEDEYLMLQLLFSADYRENPDGSFIPKPGTEEKEGYIPIRNMPKKVQNDIEKLAREKGIQVWGWDANEVLKVEPDEKEGLKLLNRIGQLAAAGKAAEAERRKKSLEQMSQQDIERAQRRTAPQSVNPQVAPPHVSEARPPQGPLGREVASREEDLERLFGQI